MTVRLPRPPAPFLKAIGNDDPAEVLAPLLPPANLEQLLTEELNAAQKALAESHGVALREIRQFRAAYEAEVYRLRTQVKNCLAETQCLGSERRERLWKNLGRHADDSRRFQDDFKLGGRHVAGTRTTGPQIDGAEDMGCKAQFSDYPIHEKTISDGSNDYTPSDLCDRNKKRESRVSFAVDSPESPGENVPKDTKLHAHRVWPSWDSTGGLRLANDEEVDVEEVQVAAGEATKHPKCSLELSPVSQPIGDRADRDHAGPVQIPCLSRKSKTTSKSSSKLSLSFISNGPSNDYLPGPRREVSAISAASGATSVAQSATTSGGTTETTPHSALSRPAQMQSVCFNLSSASGGRSPTESNRTSAIEASKTTKSTWTSFAPSMSSSHDIDNEFALSQRDHRTSERSRYTVQRSTTTSPVVSPAQASTTGSTELARTTTCVAVDVDPTGHTCSSKDTLTTMVTGERSSNSKSAKDSTDTWPSDLKIRKGFEMKMRTVSIEAIQTHVLERNAMDTNKMVCSCGENFGIDAIFCRKCGKRREETAEASLASLQPGLTRSHTIWSEKGRHTFEELPTGVGFSRMTLEFGSRVFVLDPNRPCRLILDVISVLVVLIDVTLIPYDLAWSTPIITMQKYNWCSLWFWTSDIVASMFTGYYQDGELEMRLCRVVSHYLRTCFPFDLLVTAVQWASWISLVHGWRSTARDKGLLGMLRIAKIGRILRLIGLLRLVKASKRFDVVFEQYGSDFLQMTSQVLKIFLFILWTCHVISCMFFAIGMKAPSDTGERWTHFSLEGLPIIESTSSRYQYFTAFHWSVSQMTAGSMEFFPLNTFERQFNIVCLLFGLIFGSTLISLLSAYMIELQHMREDQTRKLKTLQRYLLQHNLNHTTAVRVQKQVKEKLSRAKQLTEEDVPVLAMLSNSLRAQIRIESFVPHLQCYPFFRLWADLDSSALEKLSISAVNFFFLAQGDDLFRAGAHAHQAYMLVNGVIRYAPRLLIQEKRRSLGETHNAAGEDSVVSEGKWLAEAALWMHWIHMGMAEAAGSCKVCVVDAEKFVKVVLRSHLVRDVTQEYAKQYHFRLTHQRSFNFYPDDIQVQCVDYSDIVFCLDRRLQMLIAQVALQALKQQVWTNRFFSGRGADYFDELEKEVANGQCILIRNGQGEVERVLSVVIIHLTRPDGTVLTQVGKYQKDGKVLASCQLPGIKQQRGESIDDTMDRLKERRLGQLANGIRVKYCEEETVWKDSKTYRIRTKYLRKVHFATYVGGITEHESQAARMWDRRSLYDRDHKTAREVSKKTSGDVRLTDSINLEDRVFIVPSDHHGSHALASTLFAWLPAKDFEYFSTAAGERCMHRWLSMHRSTLFGKSGDSREWDCKFSTNSGARKWVIRDSP